MVNRSGAAETEVAPGARAPAMDPRSWIERLWSSIAERGRAVAVPGAPVAVDRACLLAEALLSERGEASGAAVAHELQSVLGELGSDELAGFLRFLAGGFLPDPERLQAQARAYLAEPSAAAAAALAQAAEPPRQELLRRMNLAPGGTGTLVALRRTLLGMLRREPALKPLDADLRHLFSSWFNRGFLELRRIDWQTPAAVLEKLITYEAVHEITGWEDLRRRLAPDRRCFGFFHPALPGEPLIFVEVALVEGLATAVQPLLAPEGDDAVARARAADTAIFYSISNCEDGLRGISFGNFLIKQVVEELRAECPALTRFATLSPVPGFRRWLESRLAALADPDGKLELSEADRAELLRPLAKADGEAESSLAALLAEAPPATDPSAEMQWWHDPQRQQRLRPALLRLCACYLTQGGLDARRAMDPVARFHLGNGARLERINWMGNSAARGLAESYGIMVNYLYDPATIETNHEAFVRDGAVVRAVAVDALRGLPAAVPSRRALAAPRQERAKAAKPAMLGILLAGTVIAGSGTALAAGPYALVTGRLDPRVIVVDIGKAIDPANDGTPRAIVSRVRVTPDVAAIDPSRNDAKYIGVTQVPGDALPNNIVIGPGGKAYISDHTGISRPADVESGMPHGYPGALTVLDLKKALDPARDNTTGAIDAIYRSGGFGPAGIVVTPDGRYAMIANSEGIGNEDGADEIGVINLAEQRLERILSLARGRGGQVAQTAGHSCAEIFRNPALVPHTSPDPNWGCFPDPNGLAYTPRHGGTVFSANEGTHDVSVIDVAKAIGGAPDWEVFRVPVERGPWQIVASPDGRLVALTDRDSDETDEAGRFISLIDVDKAIAKSPDAEIGRVLVGTDDPQGRSHPFGLGFTPDGSRIVVANDLAGNLSVVDVAKAVSGAAHPEVARIALALPATPGSGIKPRPRAVSVTPDGRYAVVAGGEPNAKAGGTVWVVDLRNSKVVGTVTGVGNQPYLMAITTGEP